MGDAVEAPDQAERRRPPWNRGRLLGQKPPLKLREVWAIRIRLQIAERLRDLALFNFAITASCGAATWSRSGSMTSCSAGASGRGQRWCSARRAAQCSSS